MGLAHFHAGFTVVLFITFVGIVIWAYSRHRKKDFDEAARLPFTDEEPANNNNGDHK